VTDDAPDTSGTPGSRAETIARMRAIATGLHAFGLDARVHDTRGVLDITATAYRPGSKDIEVICDEDGYVQISYWNEPSPPTSSPTTDKHTPSSSTPTAPSPTDSWNQQMRSTSKRGQPNQASTHRHTLPREECARIRRKASTITGRGRRARPPSPDATFLPRKRRRAARSGPGGRSRHR